jgi:hypothetical protein
MTDQYIICMILFLLEFYQAHWYILYMKYGSPPQHANLGSITEMGNIFGRRTGV